MHAYVNAGNTRMLSFPELRRSSLPYFAFLLFCLFLCARVLHADGMTKAGSILDFSDRGKPHAEATETRTTYTISGEAVVSTATTTTGLAGVTISRSGSTTTATTATDGTFSITGLAAGDYTITPGKAGFVFNPPSAILTVGTAGNASISFTAIRVFTISGHIATAAGANLAGVSVERSDVPFGSSLSPVLTNSLGNFTLTGVRPGAYTITPSKSGYGFISPSISVTVTTANAANVNFTALAAPFISGRVTTATGAGLAGVKVTRTGGAFVNSNADGYYGLPAVPAGASTLTPTLSGYTFGPASAAVTVPSAGGLTGIDFVALQGASLSGRVTDPAGSGVAGMTVTLGTGASAPTAVTNAAGYYAFSSLAAGARTVTPAKTGYMFLPASKSVTVGSTAVGNVNFLAAATPCITGRVTTATGAALTGTRLTCTGTASASTYVNAEGYFAFAAPAAGAYTIRPARTGYTFMPVYTTVTTTADAPSASCSFVGLQGVAITGRVTGSAGLGVAGVQVTRSGGGVAAATVTTNGSGYYGFASVPAGTFTITPALSGYSFAPTSRTATVSSTAGAANVNFTLLYSITGKVLTPANAGVSGVIISRTGSTATVTTNTSGVYSITGLAAGTYTITPAKTGSTFISPSLTVTAGPANVTNANFTQLPGAAIYGRVTTADGAGVSGVRVTRLGGSTSPYVLTNAQGYYGFGSVPAGTFTLVPYRAGYGFVSPLRRAYNMTANKVVEINFSAKSSRFIRGRVVSITGPAVGGVTMRCAGMGLTISAGTNGEGYYAFGGLQAGEYTITPAKTGLGFLPPSRPITIDSADVTTADFTSIPGPYISGQVTDSAGAGVAGVTMRRTGGSGTTVNVTTDANGYYAFSAAPAGTYTITPIKTGYAFNPASQSVTVSSTVSRPYTDFVVKQGHTISGRVTSAATGGSGVAGVTVARSVGDGTQVATLTNAGGYYAFSAVPDGTYSVTAVTATNSFSPFPQNVTVNATTSNVTANFTALYCIIGHVTRVMPDGSRQGVAGVVVHRTGSTATYTTNDTGFYKFTGLTAGSYTISASKADMTFSPTARAVAVPTSGQAASPNGSVDFTAAGAYTISGRITNAGAGQSGVQVLLAGTDAPATTDANGNYTFTGLEARAYTVIPIKVGATFTPPSADMILPTANLAGSPNGTANFTLSSAGDAARLLPLCYYHVRDSDGSTPAAGAVCILAFEPNGIALLYLAFPDDALVIKGRYSFISDQLTLTFDDPQFTLNTTFTLNTASASVTMPFTVFAGIDGTSTWQRREPGPLHQFSLIFNAATYGEGMTVNPAMNRVMAYARAIMAINAAAPQSDTRATGTQQLTGVRADTGVAQVQFDNGAWVTVNLYGGSASPLQGDVLNMSSLASDPRINLDVVPYDASDDPREKTALIIAPFMSTRVYNWFDMELFSPTNLVAVTPFNSGVYCSWSTHVPYTQLRRNLQGCGYSVSRLEDDDATVNNIIDAVKPGDGRSKPPAVMLFTTHGHPGGQLTTGIYLGATGASTSAGYQEDQDDIWNEYIKQLYKIRDAGHYDMLVYPRRTADTANNLDPAWIQTIGIEYMSTDLIPGKKRAFITLRPLFWEWLRKEQGADFSDTLFFAGACHTDVSAQAVDRVDPGITEPLFLRDAIRARAHFAFNVAVPLKLIGALSLYFTKHLERRTHTAEEAYYNLLRVSETRQMIYPEDAYLNGQVPVRGTDYFRYLRTYFKGYGFKPGTTNPGIAYQENGWLKTEDTMPGNIWWVLFASRWSQEAEAGMVSLSRAWNNYWSHNQNGGLADPGVNAMSPGGPATRNETAYSSFLLSGRPVIPGNNINYVPRWTLNDGR